MPSCLWRPRRPSRPRCPSSRSPASRYGAGGPLTVLLALPGLFLAEAGVAAVVGLYFLAASAARRRLVLLACVLVFVGYLTALVGSPTPGEWVITVLYGLLFATGPTALGLLTTARRVLRAQLAELRVRRAEDERRAAQEALDAERAMLAREMHDVISHQVALIAVQAGALQMTSKEESAQQVAQTIRELSVTTLNELRAMVGVLRRSGRDDQLPGLDPTLEDLHALIAQSGSPSDVDLDLPSRVPLAARRAVYRALQEGLTNARKHAPGAPLVIRLRPSGSELELLVRNRLRERVDGDASTLPGGHFGLIGLAERAELLGGSFTAVSPDRKHFELRLTLPI
ncbi:two-component sensor histidine kinase [Rathayibacter rathayi]|nr:two-component sensor histidine kinase [Rathayibacter rathayi]PPG74979.1 two-component sensor histidine kinase [Rathayibacter rathayi]PPH20650.1 two-component sensor histidine kinase [Rathayibacter rathayi]PPI76079.1 two-component sensor histidine kinase [Rathayibacter rathayi]